MQDPNKTYPLLSSYDQNSAPQLPFGYPIMVVLSLIPVLWRKVMILRFWNGENNFILRSKYGMN